MKTIAIDEKTWRKLKEIREKLGAQSYNELINILIEEWRIKKIKENVESINTDIPASMVDKYLAKIKGGKEEKQ
ncbi:MAG: hypothetical protein GXO43_03760 [Crenarchaeota archaeon]|nr:hypothetical protein [Thermoproteota archaeon]